MISNVSCVPLTARPATAIRLKEMIAPIIQIAALLMFDIPRTFPTSPAAAKLA